MEESQIDWRFDHHPPMDDETINKHVTVRGAMKQIAYVLDDVVPDGREHSLMMTNLEQAMFWANAAIARQKDN